MRDGFRDQSIRGGLSRRFLKGRGDGPDIVSRKKAHRAYGVYQSGQPWEIWGPTEFYGGAFFTSRYAEPAGSRTTDAHYQLDLSFTQNFPFGDRFNIQLIGDIFNVTDNQTGYNIEPRVNIAGFMEPRSYFKPRRFQLTAAFHF